MQHLELDTARQALRKRQAGVSLDLSGVAKGYAVDLIASRLEDLGLGDYLVDVGGELRAKGRGPRGPSTCSPR